MAVPSVHMKLGTTHEPMSEDHGLFPETPAPDLLDGRGPGARADRCTVVCPTVLFTMKTNTNYLVLLSAFVALPFTVFAGTLETVTLDVQNMSCAVCPITVKKALDKVPGVTSAKVDFDKKTASVTFDPDKANPAALTKATSDTGYPSTVYN